MYPRYELFLAATSRDEAMAETIPAIVTATRAKIGRVLGGMTDVRTRSTTWLFGRATDRDHAREWCLRWAAQHGLPTEGVQ